MDVGLLFGMYHFGDGSDVEKQVDNFLSVVGDDSNILLALDYEPNRNGKDMSFAQAIQFLELVYKRTGQRPVLYSGHLIKESLGITTAFNNTLSKHRLWLAQYGPTAKVPSVWDDYWLWQYTGDGIGPKPHVIPGFQGDADLNVFNGTEEGLRATWTGKPINNIQALEEEPSIEIPDEVEDEVKEELGDLPWMKVAKSLIGTKETPGSKNNPKIISWAKAVGLSKQYTADSIPWCGLFVAYVLSEAGEDIVDTPLWALSWKSWESKTDPCYGALLVFKREGGRPCWICRWSR